MSARCGALAVVLLLVFADCGGVQDFASAKTVEESPAPTPPTAIACNTDSDAANCGVCGHDCLGGACVAGRCQPIVLTNTRWSSAPVLAGNDRGRTAPIAIDAAGVLWADELGVHRISPDGRGTTDLALPRYTLEGKTYRGYIDAIRVHGGNVFLRSYGAGRIWRVHEDGADLREVAVDPQINSIMAFDMDDQRLVWGCWSGWLFTCSLDDCSGTTNRLAETRDVTFLKVLGPRVLYVAGYGIDTTLSIAPLDGGAPTVLAGGFGYAGGMTTDEENAFVLGSQGVVVRIPLAGGDAKRDIFTGPRVMVRSGLTVDDQFVYWSDEGRGAILRAPKTGGEPEDVVTNIVRPFAIATDRAAVYFTTQGSDETGPRGAVMKVAKPPVTSRSAAPRP